MVPVRRRTFAFAAVSLALGVAAPARGDEPRERIVHVVSNGWHAGIVVARADLPADRVPERAALPDAPFLEFGWGDREFYPARDPGIGLALAAAAGANDAVIHLAPRGAPPRAADGVEVLRLAISEAGLTALVAELDAAFDRGGAPRAAPVAPGLSPGAAFFPAHGRFSLANTCNTWVARRLEAGGVAIAPAGVVTASELMARLRATSAAVAAPADE